MFEMKQVTAPPTRPLTADAFGPNDKTTCYWLAGAAFLMNARGTLIMIDPLLKTMPEQPHLNEVGLKLKVDYPIDSADVPKLDAVLYTHSDDDHVGNRTALELALLKPEIVGPPPVYQSLVDLGVDPKLIRVCRTDDRFQIGCVTIEVIPADHPWQLQDPVRFGKPFRTGDCCGFLLTTPDGSFYFPGDTRLMEEHLSLKPVDVLALDASLCTYHLNPLGAKVLADSQPNAILIPCHYGTYDSPDIPAHCGDPLDLFDTIEGGRTRGRMLAPGEPFSLREGREV